jgi:hypothetical protein
MNTPPLFYYKIYDDTDEVNFFRSALDRKSISELLKEYERKHQKYVNPDFVEFIREHDPEAELIAVDTITY